MQLAELQQLLYRLVVAPSGVDEGLAREAALPTGGLEALIAGDDRLAARERVAIYANAYFYRLRDVLKEDFPATLAVIGATDFHNLITGYLIEYPPTEPSIAYAGQHLAAFLRQHPRSERVPWIADLAVLERKLIESFCAADIVPLDADAMRAIDPSAWPALRMTLHPASHLLDVAWPVDQVLRAIERGEPWQEPRHAPSAILIWRREMQVFYRKIDAPERAALAIARDGASFGAICEVIATMSNNADAASLINQLLTRWVADGVLVHQAAQLD